MRAAPTIGLSLLVAALFATRCPADEPERGFQLERKVKEATRLDWQFAAGPAAKSIGRYDPRDQRYQLYVPPTYKSTKTWPLVLFVSPGDDPLGWRAWRKPCEDGDWLFAAAYAAGNTCSLGQRIHILLDVLDDVRRRYQIDPDRTYIAGFSGSSAVAARIAFALPDHFGGIISLSGDAPLPELQHLRRRAAERLSVALVCGSDDPARRRQEKYFFPLLGELGVRCKLWIVHDQGHELPAAWVLTQVQTWLNDDLKRRQTDRRDRIGEDEAPTRRELASRAFEEAKKELDDTATLAAGAARLRWLIARWPNSDEAEKASELLAEVRADARRGKALQEQSSAKERQFLTARAKALESINRLEDARRAWESVARLVQGDERKKAEAEAERLAGVLARTPWLGLTLAGESSVVQSVAPGGPAQRGGVKPGDRLVKVGSEKVSLLDDVRRQLRSVKPGDRLRLVLLRKEKDVTVFVKVGSPPAKED
jgi:predicted esterase